MLSIFRGLTRKFLIRLELFGRGFRVFVFNSVLFLKLGFSHYICYYIPNFAQIFILKKIFLCIFSINLQLLTQLCMNIVASRAIDVYKGKGLKLFKKKIILKLGKKE